MSYAITEADASVEAAVRRIAVDRLDAALTALSAGSDETVHTVRKRVKELRALVGLFGTALPRAGREDRALRDAGRALSGARDAAVLVATFDALAKSAPRPFDVDVAFAIRTVLAEAKTAANAADSVDARTHAADALLGARTRAEAWSLRDGGWAALEAGFVGTYATARKTMKAALKSGSDEVVHEWRKAVKAHFHHLQLMQPMWSAGLKPQIKAANRLQDALGTHHDLSLLANAIAVRADDVGGAQAIEPVLALVSARQEAVEAAVLADGARLFAEDPDAFAERMRGYWREWRREVKQSAERLAA